MIKVLVANIPKENRRTKVTCLNCESVLEYTPKIDAEKINGYGGTFYKIRCPVCQNLVYDET